MMEGCNIASYMNSQLLSVSLTCKCQTNFDPSKLPFHGCLNRRCQIIFVVDPIDSVVSLAEYHAVDRWPAYGDSMVRSDIHMYVFLQRRITIHFYGLRAARDTAGPRSSPQI